MAAPTPLYECERCGVAVYRRVLSGPPDRPERQCLGCHLGVEVAPEEDVVSCLLGRRDGGGSGAA